jgi:hypothetical protein
MAMGAENAAGRGLLHWTTTFGASSGGLFFRGVLRWLAGPAGYAVIGRLTIIAPRLTTRFHVRAFDFLD